MSQRPRVLDAEGTPATILFQVTRLRCFVHHLGNKALDAHLWVEGASLEEVVAGGRHVAAVVGILGVHVEVSGTHAVLVISCF